jgi:hypothetical protein
MLESDVHARRVLAQDRHAGLSRAARPAAPATHAPAQDGAHRRRRRLYLRLFRLHPRPVVDGS